MISSSLTQPTHDEIAQLAYVLWQNRGCPADQDTELWLEAEQQLNQRASNSPFPQGDDFATPAEAGAPDEHSAGHQPPAAAVRDAITTALMKKDARSPQLPHHTSPPAKPLVSGKPVWPKSHSN